MPFTPAHPAAVLPLRNRSRLLPWSALVIGSVAPDLEYFFLGTVNVGGHSIPGLVRFCLPIGILGWLLFHFVLKRPLTYLLPHRERARLWPMASRRVEVSLRSLAAVGLAAIVGAATHLLWDSFTHPGRWGVEHIPALSRSIVLVQGYDFTLFKLLQHGSTVIGLLLLAVVYLRWRLETSPADSVPGLPSNWARISVILILIVPTTAACAYAIDGSAPVTGLGSLRPFLWRLITSGFGFGIGALTLYSIAVSLTERRAQHFTS